ncbi:MAG TPA: hypothetical protein VNQ56_06255 [Pseudolabrys sp.]|nr:hypothetical protein [Pseudolabrys sp.]
MSADTAVAVLLSPDDRVEAIEHHIAATDGRWNGMVRAGGCSRACIGNTGRSSDSRGSCQSEFQGSQQEQGVPAHSIRMVGVDDLKPDIRFELEELSERPNQEELKSVSAIISTRRLNGGRYKRRKDASTQIVAVDVDEEEASRP